MACTMARSRSVRRAAIERGQLLGIQDARQAAHRPHQRLAPHLAPTLASRQASRDRVRLYSHIPAGDQIAVERRDRGQTPADRRADSPDSRSEIRTTFSDPGPGAIVLANVSDAAGETAPALVAHQFGKGHVGAVLIGDLWRWGMRRENSAESDLDKSWRQTVRWLVGDVPSRVEVSVRPKAESSSPAVVVAVRVRDAEYRPLDNAKVSLKITLPGGEVLPT